MTQETVNSKPMKNTSVKKIDIKYRKWVMQVLKHLVEFIIILAGLVLLGTVGDRGIKNMKIYQQIFPEYLDLSAVLVSENNLEWDGNNCVTGEEGYLVLPVTSDRVLDLEMYMVNVGESQGYIWYSTNDSFGSEPNVYTFLNGHNIIQVEKGIQYVKIMFTAESGLEVQDLRLSYRNLFELYARLHKKALILGAMFLLLLGIGFELCVHFAKGKYGKTVIMTGFLVAVGFTVLAVFSQYIFGYRLFVYMDIGSDTIQQYYPYYLNCVRRIQEGSFGIWNWEYGLGTSLINNISQIMDPYGIFVVLGGVIFGIGKVRRLIVIAQILKIFTAAILCRYFLKQFKLGDTAACVGAYLYAFNGYLMLWGQHYLLGTASVYILLVLIFVEKLIQEKKIRYMAGLALSVAAAVVASYYNGYMILLFTAGYSVIRLLNPNMRWSWKERIHKAYYCLLLVLLGVMISAVTLLPAAKYLIGSSARLESETSALSKFLGGVFSCFGLQNNLESLGRLISNNLFYINQKSVEGWGNYYEIPNVCISIFVFLFLGQLLFQSIKRCKNKRQFAYGVIITTAMILVVFNPGVSIAFNAFAYVQMRHTFVIMPVLAIVVAVVWDRMIEKHEFSISGLIVGLVASIGVICVTYQKASGEVRNYNIEVGILICIFSILLLAVWKWKSMRPILIQMVVMCIILSTICEVDYTTNNRTMMYSFNEKIDYSSGNMQNDSISALDYLESIDSSFYRVDKIYCELSTFGDPVLEGYSAVTDYNSTINYNLAEFTDMLYIDSKINAANRCFSIGKDTDIESLALLNVKYILTQGEIDWNGFEYLTTVGSTYIYQNTKADSMASFYTNTIGKSAVQYVEESQRQAILETTLIVDDENDTCHSGVAGDAKLGTFYADSSRVWGTVKNAQEGLLMLTIPDQDGWDIYVDGVKTESINADYGFEAVHLEAGEHEIEAVYHIPYLDIGIVISIIGVAGLVITLLLIRRRDKQKIENQSRYFQQ